MDFPEVHCLISDVSQSFALLHSAFLETICFLHVSLLVFISRKSCYEKLVFGQPFFAHSVVESFHTIESGALPGEFNIRIVQLDYY